MSFTADGDGDHVYSSHKSIVLPRKTWSFGDICIESVFWALYATKSNTFPYTLSPSLRSVALWPWRNLCRGSKTESSDRSDRQLFFIKTCPHAEWALQPWNALWLTTSLWESLRTQTRCHSALNHTEWEWWLKEERSDWMDRGQRMDRRHLHFQISGYYIHTLFKCLVKFKRFFLYVCESSLLCKLRLHLFDQKYCKNSNIVKYYYNLK